MRLIEQFRVRAPDGQQHTVAHYHESDGASGHDTCRYRLNGAEAVDPVDEDTFVAPNGVVLRRERQGC